MQFKYPEIWPDFVQIKTLLRFEFLKLVNRGWSIFFRLVGLLALAGIFLVIPEKTSAGYMEVLLPGLASIFLLHPFLLVGKEFTGCFKLPGSWRSTPVSSVVFAFIGVPGEFLLNIFGLVVFFLVLSAGGYSTGFILSPIYWLYVLVLIPGALGLGLLIQALNLVFETEEIGRGSRRIFELLGCVFISQAWLPVGFYQLSYLFPYTYLSELGRKLISTTPPESLFYSAGAVVGFILLAGGVLAFSFTLKTAIRQGKLDRDTW